MSTETVWVRTGSPMQPVASVDPRPWTADELGHVWYFDGGASDPDDPRSCALCDQPAWKACRELCPDGHRLEDVNARRAAGIAKSRITPAPGVDRYGFTQEVAA